MINNKELFYEELNKLIENEKIQRLKEFPQHHGSNTLKHCIAVAKRSFALAEKFGWNIDEKELARSAMLHDYYLYKIKEEGLSAFKHGTSHPLVAIRSSPPPAGQAARPGETRKAPCADAQSQHQYNTKSTLSVQGVPWHIQG